MLTLRFKQCECSLADGRLDEAFELARKPDFRAHRRGQELISRLIAALVERGQGHLAQGQLAGAKADSDKAAMLGGNLPDVAQLAAAIQIGMQSREQMNRECGQALLAARHHAEQGQLTVGQNILAAVPAADGRIDGRVEGLKLDLAARRAALESAIGKSAAALASGNWEAAVEHLSPLGRGRFADGAVRDMCGKISDHVLEEITQAIEVGRLDNAGIYLSVLDRLPIQSIAAEQHRKMLEQCRLAYEAFEAARPHEACEILERLKALWPKAKWLSQAADQAKELGDVMSGIRSSPLSLVDFAMDRTVTAGPSVAHHPVAMPAPMPIAMPRNLQASGASEKSFCLHVDGVGSFRIMTGSTVSMGPVSSSRSVDLPLMIDAGAPVVTISRSDEDYFLKSTRPVLVNEVSTTSKLLSNGDRIGIGSRCRITFRRPSAASTSAVLDLSGTRLPDAGVRQVVLLDRELIIGPGATAHIRSDDLHAPVVIGRRGQELVCRSTTEISVDGKPAGKVVDIQPGANVAVGSLRLVVARENVA